MMSSQKHSLFIIPILMTAIGMSSRVVISPNEAFAVPATELGSDVSPTARLLPCDGEPSQQMLVGYESFRCGNRSARFTAPCDMQKNDLQARCRANLVATCPDEYRRARAVAIERCEARRAIARVDQSDHSDYAIVLRCGTAELPLDAGECRLASSQPECPGATPREIADDYIFGNSCFSLSCSVNDISPLIEPARLTPNIINKGANGQCEFECVSDNPRRRGSEFEYLLEARGLACYQCYPQLSCPD